MAFSVVASPPWTPDPVTSTSDRGWATPPSRWAEQVRRFEDDGWTALLVPDTMRTPSPFPSLAAAAAVTTSLRLRTWVIAAPLRTATALLREVSTLHALTAGRFELGIGPGRPDAQDEAHRLGAVWGSAAQRIAKVGADVGAVRGGPTGSVPVAVAAAGPRMLAEAARLAVDPGDRVALALGPTARVEELARAATHVHAAAGRRVRLSHTVSGIGERLPPWLARQGITPAVLADGAAGWLPADPGHAADVVAEWQETLGIDEVAVSADIADVVAPIRSRLDRSLH
jgi:alkanesulfonate monooxygenase SsuD/methylene tetrahydromethanopterin reductase-like flavin-dependent oxidoreductase (luciferase family)